MRRLSALLVPVLLCLGPAFARAATPALGLAAASTPAPVAAVPAVSRAQAAQLLGVLNDPKQRAAFAATLEAMLKVQQAQAPAAKASAPLRPDGLGAQLMAQLSLWIARLSTQTVDLGQALGNLPAVWAFTVHSATDPVLRARVLDAAWRLVLGLGLAGGADLLARRLLRRFRAPIAAAASPAPAEAAAEESTAEEASRRGRLARAVRSLRRLPFVLLRFLLDLLPLGVFLGLGLVGTTFAPPDAQPVLLIAIKAVAVIQLADALARLLVSPREPRLRLVHLSDAGAAFVQRWVLRLVVVASAGAAIGQIGLLFGLRHSAYQALIKAVMLIDHVFLVVIVLRCRGAVARRIADTRRPHSTLGRLRGRFASVWHLVAIFYILALWLVWAIELPDGYARIWHFFLVTSAVIIVARLAGILAIGGIDRALLTAPALSEKHPALQRRAAAYHGALRSAITTVLVAVTCLALLQVWGLHPVAALTGNALGARVVSAIGTIAIAGIVALMIWESVNGGVEYQLTKLTRDGQVPRAVRLRTLLPILRTVLLVALLLVFGLTALSEIGVNIAPLLAGAGIVGVAIGFGSQKLVQDFITGLFLLLENAMQVGDWVTVAGLSGSVENLSIRTMRLRAGDGSVHLVPFSSVSTVTNVNRGIGNAAVTVAIPIEEDVDHVCDVLAEIATSMRAEPRFEDMMRSDLQLWGVDKVESGVVTIVGQVVCTDGGRWGVQREFNRRVTIRFKELGIRLATPVQTVIERREADATRGRSKRGKSNEPRTVEESPPPAALGNTS